MSQESGSRLCVRSKSELTVIEAVESVQIVVDDRERPSGVVPELEKLERVLVKIEHLTVGDYCVDGAVLIERKTAADFAQSLIDGGLFRQASQMASSPLRPAYIIEGTSAEWCGLGVSREALQGALITLMILFDVPVFRSLDLAESARLIKKIYPAMASVHSANIRWCGPPVSIDSVGVFQLHLVHCPSR